MDEAVARTLLPGHPVDPSGLTRDQLNRRQAAEYLRELADHIEAVRIDGVKVEWSNASEVIDSTLKLRKPISYIKLDVTITEDPCG
jgi:hypothetical protein